jgi:hypothetical protein
MNCPLCNGKVKKVQVAVYGAKTKAVSYQCTKCDYVLFEPASTRQVLEELRNPALKIRQKIIKISQDRLGIYLNKNIIESLNLKKGENISVSVPDKNTILIEIE